MGRDAADLHIELYPATVAEVQLQAGRFAGHHAIDGITLLLERMLIQPDHADLLSGLFQHAGSEEVVSLNRVSFLHQSDEDRAAVDLAGHAAFGVRCCAAVDDLSHLHSVSGLVFHFSDIDLSAVGIIAAPFRGIADVHVIQMGIVHDCGAFRVAANHAHDVAPVVNAGRFIAQRLQFFQHELGKRPLFPWKGGTTNAPLREIDHSGAHFRRQFSCAFNHFFGS
jgi:hypothetical protein